MHWPVIRDHFAALLKDSDLTQEQVAKAGQLHAQTAISKLLDNEKRGPSVETFVRAVHGLGLTLTGFFAALEQQLIPTPPPSFDTTLLDRLTALEETLKALITQSPADATFPIAQYSGRSAHVESSSVSGPGAGVIHHTTVGLGLADYEALAEKYHHLFITEIEGLKAQMAADRKRHRKVSRGASGGGARARRIRRKAV